MWGTLESKGVGRQSYGRRFVNQSLCLWVWRGGEERSSRGEKYKEKMKNFFTYFERAINDKQMLMIDIFLI